jgi:hypothetical protein
LAGLYLYARPPRQIIRFDVMEAQFAFGVKVTFASVLLLQRQYINDD